MTTGPLNDLGLTEKRSDSNASSMGGGGCCGGGGGCACSQAAHAPTVRSESVTGAPAASVSAGPVTSVLGITGMTCGHCIASVMNELETIQGVESVDVLLNNGGVSRVTVTSASVLDPDAVSAAVDEAGYELVDADAE
ncbi:heavy-metal-associated domain-containing protein [Mycetocola sp.]|jgi:copper chaperone CopZ|uniref:heavy-metal-associated domain-containing protein n=1 Tax=Mycetocola sp. TaxID=1871042 RepID=UPI002628AB75|nr:heavy-metal-associated domain-containing protein [Mycetocola sp.]MCU1560494.1 heavy metal transporter [Mycetocola sp.]